MATRLTLFISVLMSTTASAQYIQNDTFSGTGQVNSSAEFYPCSYNGPGVILTPDHYPATILSIDVLLVGWQGSGDGQEGGYVFSIFTKADGGDFTEQPGPSDTAVEYMQSVQLSTSTTQFNDIPLTSPLVLTSGNVFIELQDEQDSPDDGTTVALDEGPLTPGVNFLAPYYKPTDDAGAPYTGNWIVRARLQSTVGITSIAPDAGADDVATAVVVTGSGFDSSCTLSLSTQPSGTALTDVTEVSATELTATVPPGIGPGTYDVVATCAGGSATLSGGFRVDSVEAGFTSSSSSSSSSSSGSPQVSSSASSTSSSSSVAATSTLTSSSSSTSSSTTGTSSSIGATSGGGSGTIGGTSATSNRATSTGGSSSGDGLALTAIAPNSGSTSQNTSVTIEGANFALGVQVLLGSTLLTNLSARSASVLSATVPSGIEVGLYELVAINPDGSRATLPDAYTVAAPEASAGTLSSGSTGGSGTAGAPAKGCGCSGGATLDLVALAFAACWSRTRRRQVTAEARNNVSPS